jgi:hypothetical protein
MGNGVIPASQTAAKTITSAKITPNADYKAVVLWTTGSYSLILNPKYDSAKGIITFNTPLSSMSGNAVIALEDKTGKILWSWHIWRTSYNPSKANALDTYTYNVGDTIKGSIKMMKYDLGVTQLANILGPNAYENGLLYQWGRKDPFLAAKGIGNTEPVKGTDYFINSATGALDFNVGTKSKVITADGAATVNTAIANPMTIYVRRETTNADWLSSGRQEVVKSNDLWGNPGSKSWKINKAKGTKSMFDPCPPGYMTSPHYTWIGDAYTFKSDGITYMGAYYPITGYRSVDGILISCMESSGSWSSSPMESNSSLSDNVGYTLTIYYPNGGLPRSELLHVRCCAQ